MRTQTVIQMSVQRLACTGCGAEAHASCNCGKPYVPAKQRAAEAAANPANRKKTNVELAEELGVGEATVRRARESMSSDDETERVRRDGKVYRLPVRQEPEDEAAQNAEHAEGLRVIAVRGFLNRANEAKEIATLGKLTASDVTEAMIVAAQDAAAAWERAAQNLRSMKHG